MLLTSRQAQPNGCSASSVIAWLAVAVFSLAATATFAADSAYTKHAYEKCRLVKDEPGFQLRRCTGFAGIAVNHHNGDDEATVDFGEKESDDDWPGRSFVFPGATIEWRGESKAGALVPYAAIVRYDVSRGGIGGPFDPELVIYRLEGRSRSCVAASVDGRRKDANIRARALADSFARTFRCGKDKRRVEK